MAFYIKQHDTRPAYVTDLKDNFNQPGQVAIDLTNADDVFFIMREAGTTGTPKVRRAMVVVGSATDGRVQHNWLAADTDTVGAFETEFEINWQDGGIETVPNGADPEAQYNMIHVVDDLDD